MLVSEVTRRVIFSISTCGLWLAVTLALLWVLRIRDPGTRYLFLFIPLIKSLLALVRELPQVAPFDGIFMFNIQFLNPSGFIPNLPEIVPPSYEPSSAVVQLNVILILALVIAFFTWRLAGFFQFMSLMRAAPTLERETHAAVYEIVERLAGSARIPKPRLVWLNFREAPFTIGLRRPVIAVSKVVLETLTNDELEAVLAHEMAHIARRDYIYHWGTVILRDVLFFNPLTYMICSRLSFERERACDDYGSRLSQRFRLAKSLVKLAEAKALAPSTVGTRSFAPQALLKHKESFLALRVKELLGPSAYRLPGFTMRLGLVLLALVLINFDIYIIVMSAGRPLLLF